MSAIKYTTLGLKWYVKVDDKLVAGFVSEHYADIFIEAINANDTHTNNPERAEGEV